MVLEKVNKMQYFRMIGHPFIVTEKLKNSMKERITESASGRIIIPTDIKNRIEKLNETLHTFYPFEPWQTKLEIENFCIDVYNVTYDLIKVNL